MNTPAPPVTTLIDQMKWHLDKLRPRTNVRQYDTPGPKDATSGFFVAEIPDWLLKQWIDHLSHTQAETVDPGRTTLHQHQRHTDHRDSVHRHCRLPSPLPREPAQAETAGAPSDDTLSAVDHIRVHTSDKEILFWCDQIEAQLEARAPMPGTIDERALARWLWEAFSSHPGYIWDHPDTQRIYLAHAKDLIVKFGVALSSKRGALLSALISVKATELDTCEEIADAVLAMDHMTHQSHMMGPDGTACEPRRPELTEDDQAALGEFECAYGHNTTAQKVLAIVGRLVGKET